MSKHGYLPDHIWSNPGRVEWPVVEFLHGHLEYRFREIQVTLVPSIEVSSQSTGIVAR
jgi:hypothetical protein